MYILFTGAPGSKWSSVVKNIYWSDDIDHSDYSEDRLHHHDADTPGQKQLMHIGAYWDPGMEFETFEWDKPFSGSGKRIIKSHTFAHQLDTLHNEGHPIVLVYRNDVECYNWWKMCGEFSITYPSYRYYQDLEHMWLHIQHQNANIMQFVKDNNHRITTPKDNIELCQQLEITFPTDTDTHNYLQKDIKVYVYK